jgi:hypothetical protein
MIQMSAVVSMELFRSKEQPPVARKTADDPTIGDRP